MLPSEEQALTALKSTLLSLDPKTVKYPDITPATYVLESNALIATYQKHTPRYAVRNIDTSILANKLEIGVLALSAAEQKALKAAAKQSDAKVVWDKNNKPAKELLKEALSCLDYVIPKDSDASRELKSITAGTGNANFIMKLDRTASLCREFAPQLTKRAFTESMIEQLQEYYVILSEAYGTYSSDKKDNTPELDLRDRAFTYCKSIEDLIKKDAGLVFRTEPEILKQYRSETRHKKYQGRQAAKAAKSKEQE